MNNTNKTLTEAALAAKAIRAALKVAFPGTTFRVRSENFSMGDAVRISWVDGPSTPAVEAITDKFAAGTFDGMTDCYAYDHDRKGPTAKYVTCSREISKPLHDRAVADIRAQYGEGNGCEDAGTIAYRTLRKADLRQGYAGVRAVEAFPFFEVVPAESAQREIGTVGVASVSALVGNDNAVGA